MKKSAPREASDAGRRTRYPWSLLATAGVAGLVVARVTVPAWSQAVPKCSIRQWTGLHCPGCGGTRSALRMLDGDLPGAVAMNPVVVIIAVSGAGYLLSALLREWRGKPAPEVPAGWLWALAGLVLAFALTRNLPWWPFTLLVPH